MRRMNITIHDIDGMREYVWYLTLIKAILPLELTLHLINFVVTQSVLAARKPRWSTATHTHTKCETIYNNQTCVK